MTEPDPHSLRQIYANGLGRHMSASCTAAPTVSGAWMTVQCAACGMLSAISMQAEQYLWFSWCSVLFHCLRDFLVPRPYITDVSFHLCSDLVTAFIHYFPTSKLLTDIVLRNSGTSFNLPHCSYKLYKQSFVNRCLFCDCY